MNNTMNYKGYTAKIEYSAEDNCFVGHIAGIQDIVGFHADNVADLHAAFEEAVDDYLDHCVEIGKLPNKVYSGKVMLRVPPELHAKMAMKAEANRQSLNQWATDVLSRA